MKCQPIIAVCSLMLGAGGAHAVVPDPGNIYYGLATDYLGFALTPESDAEVVMMRVENGQEVILARSPIVDIQTPGGMVNYILRPSLDDGQIARYSGAAGRTNDTVGIYVLHSGVRFEINSDELCAPISDPVPALGARGTVVRVNFRYIDDDDGDCIADSWELFYFFTTEFDGTEDFDNDGITGLNEFMAGTDPLVPNLPGTVKAPLLSISAQNNIVTLNWATEAGKQYRIEWSGDLQSFTTVPSERMVGVTGRQINVQGLPKMFFRVAVTQP